MLRRELGRWDLTAIGMNQVIGSAIFLVGSQIAAEIGAWSPLAFVLTGVASLLVALSFAEVGSRFEGTGGPYLYTRAAFGPFVGFEVGWMQWFTRATSQASVVNAVALALGFYWPVIEGGIGRALLIITLTLTLAVVNVRGIRQGAWVVNTLTIGKLLPLSLFIIVGLYFAQWERLAPLPPVTMEQASAAGLLLIFTFGGYDVIAVPAGEASDPRRHLPFAFVMTIVGVTLVMTLAQVVTMTTLDDVAGSSTPMADAALGFMGSWGAAMIGIGSVVSMTGHNAGSLLTGSRMIFALAENGHLPSVLGRVSVRTRTPANAIWFTTSIVLALALSGSFVTLAAASAVARLVTYTGTCGATLALRGSRFAGLVPPAHFIVPGGWLIPVLAIVVSLVILAGASRTQLIGGAAALAAGALLFAFNARRSRHLPETAP